MAERIEGLSIGLDLDSMGIERSLGEIQRSFKTLGSSVKVEMNNLKYGEKNVSSYKKSIDSLNDTITKQQKNLSDLKAKHEDAVNVQGANSKAAQKLAAEYNKQADNLNMLERQLENANNELKQLQDEQKIASSNWTKFGDQAEKAGNKLTSIGDGLKKTGQSMSMMITAPLAGLGVASAASAVAFENSSVRIQNSLGLTAEEAENFTNIARDIYKKGFGQSAEEIETALLKVKQNLKDLDDEDLENITKKAFVLADTFDSDVNEVTRAGNNLMKGFGIEADEAFDLMAHGGQSGLNFSNEMFDNLSEYSTLFGEMGFSAQEYFQLLGKGSEAGVYNLDYVN